MAALASTGGAEAQARLHSGRGMDLHLFRPAVDSKGLLTLNGTDILGANDFSFGLILDGGFRLLPFDGFVNDPTTPPEDRERTDFIVDHYFTGTFHFNYGFANLVVAGIQIPVHAVSGPNVTVPGVYNGVSRDTGLDFQSIGDTTLHGKVRLTRVEREGIGLAALLHIQFPTGDHRKFAGEPGVAIWPVFAVEYRPWRRLRLAANVGYRFNSGDGTTFPILGETEPTGTSATNAILSDPGHDIEYDDLLTYGFGLSVRVGESIEVTAETYGSEILASFADRGATSMEAIAGLKVFVDPRSYLVFAGGLGIPTDGFQAARYRGMLGFIFEPSIGDRDGDGLKDDVDECPTEPEDHDGFADEDGCPDPDNDRDGILDIDDECPLIPEDRDGDADEDGCPEGNEGDRDGDGILDNVDECPDDPEDRDGFQDDEGCPDPDNDQDGILDIEDVCPLRPEDRDDFEDQDGCPDPDNDQDRILDVNDECPNVPEVYNGYQDEDGCHDVGEVVIEGNDILILRKILFETDSAVIRPESFSIVDAVAQTLQGNPNISFIEIQGHADERATDEYNIRLTRDRAASVLEALVQRGVDRSRMRSAGYGERCPEDPRSNPAAWEKNRRVEFKILRTSQGETGVEVACPLGRDLTPH